MGKYSELVHALKSFSRRPLEILRSWTENGLKLKQCFH